MSDFNLEVTFTVTGTEYIDNVHDERKMIFEAEQTLFRTVQQMGATIEGRVTTRIEYDEIAGEVRGVASADINRNRDDVPIP